LVTKALFERHPQVDGVFYPCDDVAVGGINWLREAGIRVPEDVAVVGFNDAPRARFCPVPLTTIRQPVEALARGAVEMVASQLADGSGFVCEPRVLDGELVIRRSTNPDWRDEPGSKTAPAGADIICESDDER